MSLTPNKIIAGQTGINILVLRKRKLKLRRVLITLRESQLYHEVL